jgi:hypothetical protein
LEGPLLVIFQSGIVKIPSDHQEQEQRSFYRALEKVGLIRLIYQAIMVGLFYQTRKCVVGTPINNV